MKKRVHETYKVSLTATDIIHRVGRLLKHQADAFLQARGVELSAEQWGLLLKIAEREGRPQGALADQTIKDFPNITRLLDGLERKGLIKRGPSPDDRRKTLVYLTEAGRRLMDDVLPEVIEEKSKFYDGLDEADIARLVEILGIIEKNIIRHYE